MILWLDRGKERRKIIIRGEKKEESIEKGETKLRGRQNKELVIGLRGKNNFNVSVKKSNGKKEKETKLDVLERKQKSEGKRIP